MGDQGSVVLGGGGWVHALQPGVALDLLQGRSALGVPLKHSIYQTGVVKKGGGGWGEEKAQTLISKSQRSYRRLCVAPVILVVLNMRCCWVLKRPHLHTCGSTRAG